MDGEDEEESEEEQAEGSNRRRRGRRDRAADMEAKKKRLRGDIVKAAGSELCGW
jgi:hypothetical protein